jgi:hypothetical protein
MSNCEKFYKFSLRVNKIMSYIGLVLNALCMLVFIHSKILKNSYGNVYKYLLAKTICDLFICIRMILLTEFSKEYFYLYGSCLFEWIFHMYFGFVLLFLSVLFKVAINFDFFRTLTYKLRIFDEFL